MKLGVVLPTYIYNADRLLWFQRSMASLAKTLEPASGKPALHITYRPSEFKHNFYMDTFDVTVGGEPEVYAMDANGFKLKRFGPCRALLYATEVLLWLHPEVTHIVQAFDDCIYNPHWLQEIEGLIERHPDARAWSVFRSNHTFWHKEVLETEKDALTVSLDGMSKCLSREEYAAWGCRWQDLNYPLKAGEFTIDLLHARQRPGEYWCTRQSYIDHIGEVGCYAVRENPCRGVEFVGE